MINALNALLECLVTGLFTALFLYVGMLLGLIPIMFVSYSLPPEEEDEIE